ncbi:peptidase M14 [Gramella jeungdoensis]|uniref:Peptidase M14 n=1 Tax=Gramella jeungdoensis TaxID=708091 RepID=A0ABT0Z505_9FLAO|nr:M14 family zinc carboxypeptidase [Gramella jeungdoensis]MCM8570222.1 peptidase M14 [Gramella jeungdoensis]
MKNEALKDLFGDSWYSRIKFDGITGRYLTISDIELVNESFEKYFEITEIGRSVQERPVYMYKLGSGKIKVLAWSQMHGNESTTTKAVVDLLNAFKEDVSNEVFSLILKSCSLYIIPMLNPDGAQEYTRVNANLVDLNRDLQNLSQPESRILKMQYDLIGPDFCLNLHDQRTIFSAGNKPKPATLSFLTPSKDKERSIDGFRKKSMGLIAGIAEDLKAQLPEQIGRYDDAFNINCAGDTFQNLSTPTLLFEAGHFPDDYEREAVRKYVFRALLSCLYQIASRNDPGSNYEDYFKIPENQKLFNDIIIRNVEVDSELKDVSIQFKEILLDAKIEFQPVIEKIAKNIEKFGHREVDGGRRKLRLLGEEKVVENVIVNKIFLNTAELQVKYG